MPPTEDFPFARRTMGSAIVTGAMGAEIAMSLSRPLVREAIGTAFDVASDLRKASLETARAGVGSVMRGERPTLKVALDAKDRMRRRAVGMLPPEIGDNVEQARLRFIEGEKALYYGSLRFAGDLEPAFEVASLRSKNLLVDAVRAFEDVADVALATSMRFGEDLQTGDLRKASGAKRPKPRARRPAAKRSR